MPADHTWLLFKHWARNARDTLFPARRRREELRTSWGRQGDGDARMADRYHRLTAERRDHHRDLDEQTWDDLEFPRIFRCLDTTLTLPGRHILFDRLHRLDTEADELASRFSACERFMADKAVRDDIRDTLARHLGGDKGLHLADALFGNTDIRPRKRVAWLCWSLACAGALIAVLSGHMPAWPWILMLAANFVLLVRHQWEMAHESETMMACMALLNTADTLAARHADMPDTPALAKLAARRPQRAAMRRVLRPLAWTKTEPVSWFTVWFNLLLATDLTLHAHIRTRFARLRHTVADDYTLVGSIDATMAAASFLHRQDVYCQPTFGDARTLSIQDGIHPLLPDGQANSITLARRSALITGSNMAGKTTFIKMLAINIVFAQTLGFCLARRAVMPRARVLASIHGRHSVAAGKSHYFAEIERIKACFAVAADTDAHVLVIDELFSGTNTVERIAIARSVLEALARHAIVLATTHDVELQAPLAGQFDLFHFREDPSVDGYFDYRLRPGTTHVRNAIRLLAELGFPEPVIGRAMDYAARPDA